MKSIKSHSRKNILLAPHVDDELVGAYSLLRMGNLTHIVYFEEVSPERRAEAVALCEAFNIIPVFYEEMFSLPELFADDVLISPTVHDLHPAHKRVNRLARREAARAKCRIVFYGADMSTPNKRPLSPGEQADKRQLFNAFYPSQVELLSDPKYFIFEEIFEDENTYSAVATSTKDVAIEVQTFGRKLDQSKFEQSVRYCETVEDVLKALDTEDLDVLQKITVVSRDGAVIYG